MEKVLFMVSGVLGIITLSGIIGVAIHELISVIKHNKSLKVGDLVYVNTPRKDVEDGIGVVNDITGILYGVRYQNQDYGECLEPELKKIKIEK